MAFLGLTAIVGLLIAAVMLRQTGTKAGGGQPVTLIDVRKIVANSAPLTISVLGDSTGNNATDWVVLWAMHLANSRTVVVHQWDATTTQYLKTPLRYGAAAGTVTIWNSSQSGARADFAAPILATVQPEKPDLVIYTFGHNNTSVNIGPNLTKMQDSITTRWGQTPAVITLQNPGQHEHGLVQKNTLLAVAHWADTNNLPNIQVTSAFETRVAELMLDDTHPNPVGMLVWARVVASTIG